MNVDRLAYVRDNTQKRKKDAKIENFSKRQGFTLSLPFLFAVFLLTNVLTTARFSRC